VLSLQEIGFQTLQIDCGPPGATDSHYEFAWACSHFTYMVLKVQFNVCIHAVRS